MDPRTKALYLTLVTALGLVTLLLMLFLWLVVRQYRHRIAEYRRELAREIELIDSERTRFAADLHDELGSGLSAVGLFMRQAVENAPAPLLVKAIGCLEMQQKKLREISHNLAPGVLASYGLIRALDDLFEEIRSSGNIRVQVKGSLPALTFQPARSAHLYRVMREILTNAVKHSRAEHITIEFSTDQSVLHIRVSDNGKGFTMEKNVVADGVSEGMGLSNIRSRMDILQGSVKINSVPGNGTVYDLHIPIGSLIYAHGK